MIMSNNEFATKLYDFFKKNEPDSPYVKTTPADCAAKLEGYLSDHYMVKKIIRDIECVSDMLDDHAYAQSHKYVKSKLVLQKRAAIAVNRPAAGAVSFSQKRNHHSGRYKLKLSSKSSQEQPINVISRITTETANTPRNNNMHPNAPAPTVVRYD